MKIFATVGTIKFDKLIKEMDKIAKEGEHEIKVQIGKGDYEPINCKWFRFSDGLFNEYMWADLVIAHEGAGTIFELVRMGKKAIIVENYETGKNSDLLEEFYKEGYLLWCDDLKNLNNEIIHSKEFKLNEYKPKPCTIHKEIMEFLGE